MPAETYPELTELDRVARFAFEALTPRQQDLLVDAEAWRAGYRLTVGANRQDLAAARRRKLVEPKSMWLTPRGLYLRAIGVDL